jgi:hypothetical protein
MTAGVEKHDGECLALEGFRHDWDKIKPESFCATCMIFLRRFSMMQAAEMTIKHLFLSDSGPEIGHQADIFRMIDRLSISFLFTREENSSTQSL